MKNSIFKKLVALSLAVLMLVGSGIGAAIAGIDLAGLVGIKASAEDPTNEIFYDENKGLFFTVDSAANIVGTDKTALMQPPYYSDGTYTLPNQVTDTNTGKTYNVVKVNHFAFMNSREDISKIVIPDYFNTLTLTSAAFAGMDNLVEFVLDQPDVITEGPLFELVCNYSVVKSEMTKPLSGEDLRNLVTAILGTTATGFDGTLASLTKQQRKQIKDKIESDNQYKRQFQYNNFTDTDDPEKVKDNITLKIPVANNCYPLRDNYGVLQLSGSSEEMEATVRFYSVESGSGVYSDYADLDFKFTENISKLTNVNTISKEDIDEWDYSAQIYDNPVEFSSVVSEEGKVIGLYNEDGEELSQGIVYFLFSEVSGFSYDNIVDGNGSQNKTSTIVLHKSPVASIALGNEIDTIPDYLFYDTDIKTTPLSNIVRIGKFAFVDCDGLTAIDLGNVSVIEEYAFAACDGLVELVIPENVQSIGREAFSLCDNLDTVKYNTKSCTIGTTPFKGSGVTTMIFGANTSSIPSNIGCSVPTLNRVVFLADTSELKIQDGAFLGSDSINNIEVMDSDKWEEVVIGENNGSIKYKNTLVKTHEHNCVPTTYPATCSAEGYTADVCVCGEELNKRDIQQKIDHTLPENPISSVAPSCEGQGYNLYICEVCGEAVQKNVQEALGHDYSNAVTYPATCTEPEKTVGTCSRCQNVVTTIGAPALGHDFGEYIYNNNATATKDGTETARCSRCGATDTRTAPGTSYQGKLSNAVFNPGEEKKVEYRSKVVITSRAANVPDGFYLGITVNNKLVATGDNEEVTYTVDEITEGTTFYTYIFDANGKIATKNPHKTDVANVNTGFFAKIVSFFKGLFGMLPTVNFG